MRYKVHDFSVSAVYNAGLDLHHVTIFDAVVQLDESCVHEECLPL